MSPRENLRTVTRAESIDTGQAKIIKVYHTLFVCNTGSKVELKTKAHQEHPESRGPKMCSQPLSCTERESERKSINNQ